MPFYNYLQAAYVMQEDGRLPAVGVLRVAAEMVAQHRFDGDALARSYADVAKRGHLSGSKVPELLAALPELADTPGITSAVKEEVKRMVDLLPPQAEIARTKWTPIDEEEPMPDYLTLVERHNPRHKKKK